MEHVRPKQTILHNLFALDLMVQHGDLCAFEMESMTDVTKHAFTWRTIHNLIAVGHVVRAHTDIRRKNGPLSPAFQRHSMSSTVTRFARVSVTPY